MDCANDPTEITSIPRPNVGAMKYFNRLQRDSEGYAARVFQELYPSSAQLRFATLFIADLIARAASTTTAWSVTLNPDSVRLNVGRVRLLNLSAEQIWFCAMDEPSVGRRPGVRTYAQGRFVYASVHVPSRSYAVDTTRVTRLPRILREAALLYVNEAAVRRKGLPLWEKAHSPGVLLFLEGLLDRKLPRPVCNPSDADRIAARSVEFREGMVSVSQVTRHYRDSAARDECITQHGSRCTVCDIDFGESYGKFARGFIHVHHLESFASKQGVRITNAVEDLRPVCPNCHAALHLPNAPATLDGLRAAWGARQ